MVSEWVNWHRKYADGAPLSERLKAVQGLIKAELDVSPPGPIRVISMCSGDGRDLIGAIIDHPRRVDVTARLVDLDPELVEAGRLRIPREHLTSIQFVRTDAGLSRAYEGAVPAALVLACGIYGNIADSDIRNMIGHLPEMCARDGLVIWTRGRFEPDLTPVIRRWFQEAGFDEVSFVPIPGSTMSVGAHRLRIAPKAYDPNVRLFQFLPAGTRPSDIARVREHSPPLDSNSL